MNDLAVFSSFARGEQTKVIKGLNCVIYTRVSTKEQADHNLSLDTQQKACLQYAAKCGYSIIATFGGTYESAMTDERKEFTAMLNYVKKSREKISYIIVYSLERFSRNENSIWLSTQLRKLGVEIVSVTQPIDTSNPSGQMQQKLLFIFSEFDNQLRREKCIAGMKEMLSRGDWPMRPPLGYSTLIKNSRRTIVINEQGKVLKQAFAWKAYDGLTYEEITKRLATQGIKLCRQRVAAILRNPFYCGLLANTMLEGKIIKGNHEPLISKELFLKVNGLLEQNSHGYTITEENDHLPLKRFLKCDCCGKSLRGYIVQKKRIHYYKCSTYGCNTNRNANVLHERFMSVLEYFSLDKASELITLIKKQTIATFNQYTKSHEDNYQLLQSHYKTLEQKIERLEERFIEEELTAELYNKYVQKYTAEKQEIEKELLKASDRVSNLEECIDRAIEFATKLPLKWREANYSTKQRLQSLLFPEGVFYNRQTDECRTNRVNSVFLYMAYIKQVMTGNKKGIPELNLDYAFLSCSVARRGREHCL